MVYTEGQIERECGMCIVFKDSPARSLERILILLVPIPDRAEDLRQLLVDGLAVVVERRRL
jgi:hypothetical protein